MKNKHYMLISLFFIAITFISCGDNKTEQPQQQQAPTFPVTVLQNKTVTAFQTFPTSISGIVSSKVSAKVSGYIQKVLVDEGEPVKKGQPLFKLETQSLSQDAGAAKARVNVAQVEVDKLIPLVEKGIISNVQLETAKANLAQAKASYSAINANIGYATIKSQVDGFVGAINFREGSLISPSDPTPLTTVSDISKVYAFFSLNETQYLDFLEHAEGKTLEEKLTKYPDVNLILANGSMYSEKGKIQTSSGQINQNTGTVSLRAVFENPNHLITNGSSGKIQIPTVYEDAIVVPQEATYEQQGKIMLFKLGEDNKAVNTIIEIKATVNGLYVIESGVNANDKIITAGIGKVRNDMVITPNEVPFSEVTKPIETLFRN
ncbi:efflux RND transporter periplasmic adaptor subunit [Formosa algae]|uniref:Membrane fusion protein (Multidrug efflux system) n=2 Tax=Formosa algae TaxID=225843 RepID=A0A9X0YKA9_9FLAO|nr:efflux RND transporter periplasmic adaptor subunit [Formosa algae]MBP1840174.1 membrane fusion protein (multidrug efflux system) [Formosa algae]MDQ0335774.1 membrane fusion protein (multidrug efflux system) [Formosa algae]